MPRPTATAFEAEVTAIEDLSHSFRRVTLSGAGMEGFGIEHHPQDLRFKLIIPPGDGAPTFDLPSFLANHEDPSLSWYQAWLQLDEDVRGSMRTYTVREWRDAERELIVDMVLHTSEASDGGPASNWATAAEIGSRLHVIGPARDVPRGRGGIEFDPGTARHLLLAGDETAVPAIASILESLTQPPFAAETLTGHVILEVPHAGDILTLDVPAGMEVTWLVRGERDHGDLMRAAVRETVQPAPDSDAQAVDLDDIDIDAAILWDVPRALSGAARNSGTDTPQGERPFYAWIAGEAAAVKDIRRYLVQDIGIDRRQVAFMGYWRKGRAEGS